MVEETVFTLPKIPALQGEENLDEWRSAVRNHFKWHDIYDHITSEIPQPGDATAARA